MSLGSAKIIATPSKITELGDLSEMGVEVQASPSSPRREEDYTYTYNFGTRKQGDHQIDVRKDSKTWSTPQDIEVLLHCHAEDYQLITHVEIKVDQSSTDHEAHIIDGGIGEKFIRILVKAKQTRWFRYEARVYAN